ncbi:trypsin-like peptidase domain-containing protein [Streptomyces sp. HUAS MG47]|uniref:S1C family serine protease n=1 Tax=Streptomyces solicamelliae TaxID=3231716 RepID=UPI0038781313
MEFIRAARLLALPLCAVALLGGCTAERAPAPGRSTQAAPVAAADLEADYQTVIKDVLPSVVQVESGGSLGSGVVYDDKGHIVTNAHVVGNERVFRVTSATGGSVLGAKLVATYPAQDLAVIRLDTVPGGVKAATFGDSTKVEVGQIVLAMGSPLGLSGSVTQGIVSAVGRTVSESSAGGTGATIANMVQTSAAINPGNSGGALVNLESEVIGIPTLAAVDPRMGDSAAPGIGFAIPVSMVRTVADQIIEDGRVTDSGRAGLNITGRTVVDRESGQPVGVAVVEVTEGGAADDAGIRAGDVITKVGEDPITTITSLAEALAGDQPGEKVTVTYERGGQSRSVEVTLGEI